VFTVTRKSTFDLCIDLCIDLCHTCSTFIISLQMSDILEAINFFVSAFEFGFLQAMVGVRQMLNLVWSREATVKEAVVNAYKKLYIDSGPKGQVAQYIVRNFVSLVNGATVGELASLEELLCMLVGSGDIDRECFQVLWQYFTKCGSASDISDEDSRSALVLLGMIASAEPAVITSNMALLVRTALTERGRADFQLVHDACVALVKVATVKRKPGEPPTKLDSDHEVFSSLKTIVVDGIKERKSDFYVPMCQKAFLVVYHFGEQPDVVCGDWLKEICRNIMADACNDASDDRMDQEDREASKAINADELTVRRLVSIVGHLAVCQLNHLDVTILNELKRRKALRNQKSENKKTAKSSRRKSSMGAKRYSWVINDLRHP
jgi:condensin complex subunit 1